MNTKLRSALVAVGLSDLAGAFADQGIDDSLIAELTDADLQSIGISKLGDRKKLLKAFSGISENTGTEGGLNQPANVEPEPNRAHVKELIKLVQDAQPAFERYAKEEERLTGAGNFDEKPQFPSAEVATIGNFVLDLMKQHNMQPDFPKEIDLATWSEDDWNAGNCLRGWENQFLRDETVPGAHRIAYQLACVSSAVAPSLWRDAIEWRLAFMEHCGIGCEINPASALRRFEKVASYYDKFAYTLAEYFITGTLFDPGVCHDNPAFEARVNKSSFPASIAKAREWTEKYKNLTSNATGEDLRKAIDDAVEALQKRIEETLRSGS